MRCLNHHHDQRRSGFTLLELLIVLIILVTVIGLSLPSLRSSLDKSRLTAGAKDVQAALAKARSLAIREATLVQFRYELRGRRFVIERCPTPSVQPIIVMDQGEASTSQSGTLGTNPRSDGSNDGDGSTESDTAALGSDPQAVVLREGVLPVGVVFADDSIQRNLSAGVSGADAVADSIAQAVPTQASSIIVGPGTSERWSVPVIFSPAGRTRSRSFLLQGQRDFYIEVYLRGLTSSASYSSPRKRAAVDGAMLPDGDAPAVDQGAGL